MSSGTPDDQGQHFFSHFKTHVHPNPSNTLLSCHGFTKKYCSVGSLCLFFLFTKLVTLFKGTTEL